MSRTITIDPVTRIEGHAKITIHLDESGRVADARFHVTEFRGFEKFCEGRSFWEMPGITARICGICPVSHLLASAKAGDAILGVRIPPTAEKLRRLMNWAQIVQSHALSFFHLSGPDLLLGMESDPAQRNLVGLLQKYPDVARQGIQLRQFGQEVIRLLGGKSIHPAWAVPGGVREPLADEERRRIQAMLPAAYAGVELGLKLLKDALPRFDAELRVYGAFPSLFAGLVTPDGGLEHYDGVLRVIDSTGNRLEPGFPPDRFREIIGEAVEPWSYLKFPYYRPLVIHQDGANAGRSNGAGAPGYEAGMYRVGPLARLNVCDYVGTPRADAELRQFRTLAPAGKPVTESFHYHYARLIEILFALEKIEATLDDPTITDSAVRSQAGVNNRLGVGVSEAPRGTLFHEYQVDENGILQRVNLMIATGQNNLAMNRTVRQIAEAYINGRQLREGILNRIEHGIRAFDPCLSCSTHAIGQMPLHVQLINANGEVVDEAHRD
ncbi:MAG TPA: Ni/Fe hydrogenase subunit alpha [Caldilineaceae bacterium]|nr:Ni/Fe hydrogenase subunit alpha [Caldilineaceae bacterium]